MALNELQPGEIDIQDAFDSLLVCEDNFVQKAYQEGLAQGEKIGFQEGFDLGVRKGSEIGSEIHFYKGFVTSWITFILESSSGSNFLNSYQQLVEPCVEALDASVITELNKIVLQVSEQNLEVESSSRALKELQKLLQLLQSFPADNPQNQDVISLLEDIRAKFKHCCALLKVETVYSAKAELNF